MPLDGQALDTIKYKRLVDYLGFSTLPDLNGRYLRVDSTPGRMVDAGLPNIMGRFKLCGAAFGGLDDPSGAFYTIRGANGGSVINKDDSREGYLDSTYGNFDASHSNPIYGNSDTVTPLTYTVRAYICYA